MHGVIHLWGVGSVVAEETSLAKLDQQGELVCGSVLHLVAGADQCVRLAVASLWLVTRGAQPVEIDESPAPAGIAMGSRSGHRGRASSAPVHKNRS